MKKELYITADENKMNTKYQIKANNRKLYGQISAFICVHLRLIFVSLRDRTQEIQFNLFPIINKKGFVPGCQKIIESTYDYQTHSCLNLLENKPQINADERRFAALNLLVNRGYHFI
jgi:hypothetical protein